MSVLIPGDNSFAKDVDSVYMIILLLQYSVVFTSFHFVSFLLKEFGIYPYFF